MGLVWEKKPSSLGHFFNHCRTCRFQVKKKFFEGIEKFYPYICVPAARKTSSLFVHMPLYLSLTLNILDVSQRVLQFFLILQNPLPPKVTKSTFYNISSSLLMLSASNLSWWDKSIFTLTNKIVLDGKPKMTKKFEFKQLKISNPDIWPFWEIFNFSNSIFFLIFGFPLKKYFFLKINILLSYQTIFWHDSVNRKEDIL